MTIGSGIRFTFDRVSYTDVALESGKVYRVFIRLYSGADTPVREREGGREGERGRGGQKKREARGRKVERELEGEQTVHMYILLGERESRDGER